jgi:hypothetical protein
LILTYERENPRDASADVPAWVLPPLSCQFLEDVVAILPAGSRGFEFGSGRSTHALRRGLAGTFSIEHSAEWLEQTEKLAPTAAKRVSDETAVLPLKRCWNRLRPIESFDLRNELEVFRRLQQSRLVLVDSPPNPTKREHVLFLALQHTSPGTVIVLDDLEIRATARFAERVGRQNRELFRFWILDIDHRLGVFLKLRQGRIHSLPSLIEFVGTWLRA